MKLFLASVAINFVFRITIMFFVFFVGGILFLLVDWFPEDMEHFARTGGGDVLTFILVFGGLVISTLAMGISMKIRKKLLTKKKK